MICSHSDCQCARKQIVDLQRLVIVVVVADVVVDAVVKVVVMVTVARFVELVGIDIEFREHFHRQRFGVALAVAAAVVDLVHLSQISQMGLAHTLKKIDHFHRPRPRPRPRRLFDVVVARK